MKSGQAGSPDWQVVQIQRGIAIYKTSSSPYWNVRIRDKSSRKYVVRSTKETTRIAAREAALEFAQDFLAKKPVVPAEFVFKSFAKRFLDQALGKASRGERNANYVRTAQLFLDNDDWGLLKEFGSRDVRELKTRDFVRFIEDLQKRRPDLSPSTFNMLSATFRNVLKVARNDGTIDDLPATPRPEQRDNPRAFFRFYPLTTKSNDTYKKLLKSAKELSAEGKVIRGVAITDELYDLILFVVHSFVRPTITELYDLRYSDCEIADDPDRVVVTVRNGKNGFRIANTMSGAVAVLKRIKKRYPDIQSEDFIFLPHYKNRSTASRIIQRQFNAVLEHAGIKHDPFTNSDHTMYSLRHTAICMRLILSEGKVNIFNLAKNAGTSVEQIERFYARNLPLSKEMARNLQSFGGQNETTD